MCGRYGLGLHANCDGELAGAAIVVTKVDSGGRRVPRTKVPITSTTGSDDETEDAGVVEEEQPPDVNVGDKWVVPDEGTLRFVVTYTPTRRKNPKGANMAKLLRTVTKYQIGRGQKLELAWMAVDDLHFTAAEAAKLMQVRGTPARQL